MWKNILINLLSFYQRVISPFISIHLNLHCRYYPSCSEYARMAIMEWGALKGSYLALKRFLRCNPFFPGGVDFPPTKKLSNEEKFYGQ